jgi:hypothetical protein
MKTKVKKKNELKISKSKTNWIQLDLQKKSKAKPFKLRKNNKNYPISPPLIFRRL